MPCKSSFIVDLGQPDPRGLADSSPEVIVRVALLTPARRRQLARAIATILAKDYLAEAEAPKGIE